MMLRKRVWDIMREDFASVQEDASLAETVMVLRESRKIHPDNTVVLVFSKDNHFLGLLSMWNLIQGMGPCLLKRAPIVNDEVNWDKAFRTACEDCAHARIMDCLQTDVPMLKPNDPLARVMEVFLDYRRGRAVVEEGGRIIGLVALADLFREIADTMDLAGL